MASLAKWTRLGAARRTGIAVVYPYISFRPLRSCGWSSRSRSGRLSFDRTDRDRSEHFGYSSTQAKRDIDLMRQLDEVRARHEAFLKDMRIPSPVLPYSRLPIWRISHAVARGTMSFKEAMAMAKAHINKAKDPSDPGGLVTEEPGPIDPITNRRKTSPRHDPDLPPAEDSAPWPFHSEKTSPPPYAARFYPTDPTKPRGGTATGTVRYEDKPQSLTRLEMERERHERRWDVEMEKARDSIQSILRLRREEGGSVPVGSASCEVGNRSGPVEQQTDSNSDNVSTDDNHEHRSKAETPLDPKQPYRELETAAETGAEAVAETDGDGRGISRPLQMRSEQHDHYDPQAQLSQAGKDLDPPDARDDSHKTESSDQNQRSISPVPPAHLNANANSATTVQHYKILAYDPTTQCVDVAETISSVAETATALTPAEVIQRLSNPAKFFPHFGPLQTEGYEILSGSGDVLIFRKVRDQSAPPGSGAESPAMRSTDCQSRSSGHTGGVSDMKGSVSSPGKGPVNPIDMTGSRPMLDPSSWGYINPTGFVNYTPIPLYDKDSTSQSGPLDRPEQSDRADMTGDERSSESGAGPTKGGGKSRPKRYLVRAAGAGALLWAGKMLGERLAEPQSRARTGCEGRYEVH